MIFWFLLIGFMSLDLSDCATTVDLSNIQTVLSPNMQAGYLQQYNPGSQCDLLQTTYYCMTMSNPPTGQYSYTENGMVALTPTCNTVWINKAGDNPCYQPPASRFGKK